MAAMIPSYHGNINRIKTEHILLESGLTGSYLVRSSENIKGAYVLCVLNEGKIFQYRILPTGNGLYEMKYSNNVKGDAYSNLAELITSVQDQGLCCPLRHPIPVAKEEEGQIESDDEDDDDRLSSMESSASQEDPASILTTRLTRMGIHQVDRPFAELLAQYVSSGIHQDMTHMKISTEMKELRSLIQLSAVPLKRESDILHWKLKVLQGLFDLRKQPTDRYPKPRGSDVVDLKKLFQSLKQMETDVKTLDKQANTCLQTLTLGDSAMAIEVSDSVSEETDTTDGMFKIPLYKSTSLNGSLPGQSQPSRLTIAGMRSQSFEVRVEARNMVEALKQLKLKLTVDVKSGVLISTKNAGKDTKEEAMHHKQDSIVQLIKARDHNTKLCLKFNTGKKKDYTFEDAKQRETFCQLVQYMKQLHTNSKEVDQVSVFIGSWNMGDAAPPNNILSWFSCQGDGKQRDKNMPFMGHDLYIIGTQESALSEKEWLVRVKAAINQVGQTGTGEYKEVTACSLWGIRLVVLAKTEHLNRISHVRESSVKTGIANTLGNKGAVGVSFNFSNTTFCFINTHLTSGTEKKHRRNQNYHDILKGLNLSPKGLCQFDLTNKFHHLFWLGDLNYRIEWTVPEILQNIKLKHYDVLMEYDQLRIEKDADRVFVDFNEELITFPPTYRYELGIRGNSYSYKKVKKSGVRINEPSWCDRVLWRSYPSTYIENTAYGCSKDIMTSDHSPVFASFLAGIVPPSVIPKSDSAPPVPTQEFKIIFTEVEASIVTAMCGDKYYLDFHSSCLNAGSVRSKTNSQCVMADAKTVRSAWEEDSLPLLVPIIQDIDYLGDQHILIALKSEDADESYGECVVSLNNTIVSKPVEFKRVLTHQGQRTGVLKGKVYVQAKDESIYGSSKKLKTYELVSFEDSRDSTTPPIAMGNVDKPDFPPTNRKMQKGVAGLLPLSQSPLLLVLPRPSPSLAPSLSPSVSPSANLNPPFMQTTNKSSRFENNNNATTSHSDKPTFMNAAAASGLPPPLPPPRSASPFEYPAGTRPKFPKPSESDAKSSDERWKSETISHRPPLPPPGQSGSTEPPRLPSRPSLGELQPRLRTFSDGVRGNREARTPSPPLFMKQKPMLPTTSTEPKEEEYADLRRPPTISSWLMDVGLPQYTHNLVDNGWDNMAYVDQISNADLVEAGVADKKHRERILESLKSMPT